MKRKEDLAIPRQRRRIGVHYDYDAFGQFSESIARTLGTARFLVWQSFLIIAWIIYNFVLPESWQFDPWNRGLVRQHVDQLRLGCGRDPPGDFAPKESTAQHKKPATKEQV